jgi:hypothetical protein
MKKILLLLMISGLWLSACDDREDDDKEIKVATESAGTKYNQKNFSKQSILDKEVDSAIARRCVDSMAAMYEGTDYAAMKKSYTGSVSFGSENLYRWISDKHIFENSDSIALRMGVYTREAVTEWQLPESYYGRTTIFVWPYKIGMTGAITSLDNPFNVGSLHP